MCQEEYPVEKKEGEEEEEVEDEYRMDNDRAIPFAPLFNLLFHSTLNDPLGHIVTTGSYNINQKPYLFILSVCICGAMFGRGIIFTLCDST